MNTWKRRALALLSVPLLAIPSAAGVYLWLSPHIGPVFAGLTASGFETMYISINILVIETPELRRYARNVALSGVATAIIFNTLARYQMMVCPLLPDDTIGACTLRTVTFDWTAIGLAVLESIPLAGLAYAMSVLLHRLGAADAPDGLADSPTTITQAVQVNVSTPLLPPNVAAYIAAKAAEHPDMLPDELATLIGVGVRSVQSVLQLTKETQP